MHNHCHCHCHCNHSLKYYEKCDTVYCEKCNAEWSRYYRSTITFPNYTTSGTVAHNHS